MTVADIRNLVTSGALTAIDGQFAAAVQRLARTDDPLLFLSAALASHALGQGHMCVDLATLAGTRFPPPQAADLWDAAHLEQDSPSLRLPDLDAWLAFLRSPAAAPVVGRGERKPLVLDHQHRLYLHRYWRYEQDTARRLAEMATARLPETADTTRLRQRLETLFPDTGGGHPSWQRLAAFLALRNRLTIVSGGPGTGKTFTVARILALVIEEHRMHGTTWPLRILLTAPTGKAVNRLSEAIRRACETPAADAGGTPLPTYLPCAPDIRRVIPTSARTIHRLIGASSRSAHCRFNRGTPLAADLVVVDEASMVALPLMAKLLDALPPDARLILLGDMNQLASVEPGYVLGDLCRADDIRAFSAELVADAAETAGIRLPDETPPAASAMADCTVELQVSRRFPPGSAIDRISRAINATESEAGADRAFDVLQQVCAKPGAGTSWRPTPFRLRTPDGQPDQVFRDLVLARFRDFLNATAPAAAFAAFNSFRIVCALRRGPHGVETVNHLVESVLSFARVRNAAAVARRLGVSPLDTSRRHYSHRPIMVTENCYPLGLFNGDIGLILPERDGPGAPLTAFFEEAEGTYRSLRPELLPAHETVFAMTVHKSQGSEFGSVLLLLPATPSRVLTRELVYTGLTRARERAEVWATRDVFVHAAAHRTRRQSGLAEALHRHLRGSAETAAGPAPDHPISNKDRQA